MGYKLCGWTLQIMSIRSVKGTIFVFRKPINGRRKAEKCRKILLDFKASLDNYALLRFQFT